jgi:hypothetical protein
MHLEPAWAIRICTTVPDPIDRLAQLRGPSPKGIRAVEPGRTVPGERSRANVWDPGSYAPGC